MATASTLAPSQQQQQQRPRWCLKSLSYELLILMLEQLRDICPESLRVVRTLCSHFNNIATPISYRTVVLNERITAPDAEHRYPGALEHIRCHTNHIVARSDLDPVAVKRILGGIKKLTTLRWQYVNQSLRSASLWLPADVLPKPAGCCPTIRLYIEGLPLRDFDTDVTTYGEGTTTYYERPIPTDMLVSLKMAHSSPPLTTRLGPLKRLLLAARGLETFHYEDRGQGTHFTFNNDDKRLPAFGDLVLRHYDWRHSADDVAEHWDFSRLRHLELTSVPIFNFLSSVSLSDFANLRTLHVEDYSAHLPDKRKDATRALASLIKQHIRALHTLKITCHTDLFPTTTDDTLARHAPTLRVLSLRDHAGFGDESQRCPTLQADQVAGLARTLTQLHTLELDLDGRDTSSSPASFLAAVCAFPRLHTLTLHVQTVLSPLDSAPPPPGRDPDREAAGRMMALLCRNKSSNGVRWRRITVNVGGWKKVMFRRLGEGWRRLNEEGLFAERCFVLEKAGDGVVRMREEMCLESPRAESSMGMDSGHEEEEDDENDDEDEDDDDDEEDDEDDEDDDEDDDEVDTP